jgi:hypothetical protein
MNRIILNSGILTQLTNKTRNDNENANESDNKIQDKLIIFKETYKNGFRNYFFSPNIGIKLYSPKVSWLDSKGISFCFNKVENMSLLDLLKYINSSLDKIYINYKTNYGLPNDSQLSSLYYEKGDFFYIKCHLPNSNGKYFITYNSDIEKNGTYTRPRIGCVYNSVTIDIRNIWETDNKKAGVHLELKEIYNNFNINV